MDIPVNFTDSPTGAKILAESKERDSSDPVHQIGNVWYFYDETWIDRYGPYDTEKEARAALKRYCDGWL